jgi:hypothetical protein
LTWPNGEEQRNVVFTAKDAAAVRSAHQLTTEDPRIRELVIRLPRFVPGQPILRVAMSGLSKDVRGIWSLWRVGAHPVASPVEGDRSPGWRQWRFLAVFVHDDGRVLLPTARHIWDAMLGESGSSVGHVSGAEAEVAFGQSREVAEAQGRPLYDELLREHRNRLEKERAKAEYAHAARRRATERIGLPEVRAHRIAQLDAEEAQWREQFGGMAEVVPEMTPLLLAWVEGGTGND